MRRHIHPGARARSQERHAAPPCDRVRLFEGDLYRRLRVAATDIIVANPPYVSDGEMSELPTEYGHDGRRAAGGRRRLDVVRRNSRGCGRHLETDGTLFFEVGDSDARPKPRFPACPFSGSSSSMAAVVSSG